MSLERVFECSSNHIPALEMCDSHKGSSYIHFDAGQGKNLVLASTFSSISLTGNE